ncbi:small glutamine-rich tetratricopeptide repeat-containing protein beta isoform X1 [Cucurbita moschata]|uniref:Small glutamine-rich tetratricopeptide repeat-containing protein beta isoform X1 n=1 Tax=Cucurbita moschata TaxID=3662 RepID=A0A6J1EAV3_CUCMO|nr:small glutamine-rich tetratricopeptide repeat-containing protein beta isoform X1 [Cucurbita moschata]
MTATLCLLCIPLRFPPNRTSFSSTSISLTPIRAQNQEIRVCTNRTCRRQGSFQTLETLSALAPPTITVNPSGCLGKCGAGPNVAVLPDGFVVGHCATPARAAEVIMQLSGGVSDSLGVSKSLEALALRKRAECEVEDGNFSQADLLLSKAIELKPCGGIHIIFKDRSIVRLALGNHAGALEDANEALRVAPRYPEAYICQGDVFLSMDHFDSAEMSYSTALEIEPSIRRSKSFKARVAKLQEKLNAVRTQ